MQKLFHRATAIAFTMNKTPAPKAKRTTRTAECARGPGTLIDKPKKASKEPERAIWGLVATMRTVAIALSGISFSILKRWKTGLWCQAATQLDTLALVPVLKSFSGNSPWDEEATCRFIEEHTPRCTWQLNPPTYQEFLSHTKCAKKKATGPHGLPPYLVQHLQEEHPRVLFEAITAICHGAPIPKEWLVSCTVLVFQENDPADLKNYHPLTVSDAIYTVYTKTVLSCIRVHTTKHLTKEHHKGKGVPSPHTY